MDNDNHEAIMKEQVSNYMDIQKSKHRSNINLDKIIKDNNNDDEILHQVLKYYQNTINKNITLTYEEIGSNITEIENKIKILTGINSDEEYQVEPRLVTSFVLYQEHLKDKYINNISKDNIEMICLQIYEEVDTWLSMVKSISKKSISEYFSIDLMSLQNDNTKYKKEINKVMKDIIDNNLINNDENMNVNSYENSIVEAINITNKGKDKIIFEKLHNYKYLEVLLMKIYLLYNLINNINIK